jgi:signal transduction histidine kinase
VGLSETAEGAFAALDAADPTPGLTKWRVLLLRALLPVTAGAFVLGWFALALVLGEKPFSFWYALVPAALLLGASRYARRAPQALSIGYAVAGYVMIAEGVRLGGWSPGVVMGIVCLQIFVGLLLGRAASYMVIAGVLILFWVGGLAVRGAIPIDDLPSGLQPTSLRNWLRVSLLFVLFTGAVGWSLGRIGFLLQSAEWRLSDRLLVLREELALLLATRARRARSDKALENTHKVQLVAQLGHGLAHAFGNVLTAIRSAVDEARRAVSRAQIAEVVAGIEEAVAGAAERSRDLLALLRPRTGLAEEIDVHRALAALGPRMQGRLRENVGLSIELHAGGLLGVNEAWLEQVLMTVVLNAQQAMPAGGSVVVSTHRLSLERACPTTHGMLPAGTYVVIRVTDDGPGISDEVAERAFEPFFTTRRRERHDGLGLTIALDMTRKAGGTIQIERPARGASVVVYLPLVGQARDARLGTPSSSQDEASVTRHEVAPWKPKALQSVLLVTTVGAAVAIGVTHVDHLLTPGGSTLHLKIGIPALIAYTILTAVKRALYRLRVALYMVVGLAAGLSLVTFGGFMAPVGTAGASLVIALAWILGSPRMAKAGLAGAWLVLILAGWLHASGHLVALTEETSLARADNWFRIAVTIASVSFVGAAVVIHVLRAAEARVLALTAVESELEAARTQQRLELDAVVDVEAIMARAGRIEALGRLTGMTAHDLNNSLQAMLMMAEGLLDHSLTIGSETFRAELEGMGRAADHAEAVVSRLEFGTMPPAAGGIDLGAEALRSDELLRSLLREGQRLTIEQRPGAIVAIDEHAFRRLLLNLVANARDAMGASGSCAVSIVPSGDTVEVTVTDDGCGMDEGTKEHLFEIFFTTKGQKGTGLGLHSVAVTVQAAGGSVEVWSEPGRGTRVMMRFPRAQQRRAPPARVEERAGGPAAGRVLLAEDDALVRRFLRRGLERVGFHVTEAQDGDEAASLVMGAPFDALCTDAVMPGLPAGELIADFRARGGAGPVVVISGYLPEERGIDVTGRPEVTFLHKPFTASRLAEVLTERLAA